MGCVYKATCIVNGKSYIGKTYRKLSERRYEHESCPFKSIFHKAIRKYGKDSFTWDILYSSDDETDLYEKEKYFIHLYNTMLPSGYNMTTGGDGQYSRVFSDDWHCANVERAYAVAKKVYCVELNILFRSIQDAHQATGVSTNWIVKVCNDFTIPQKQYHFCWGKDDNIEMLQLLYIQDKVLYGRNINRSPEAFANRSRSQKARKDEWTQERKEAHSKRMTGEGNCFYGKRAPDWVLAKAAAVTSVRFRGAGGPSARSVKNLTDGKVFACMLDAVKEYNLPPKASSNISSCCSGKLKSAYGFQWAYNNEPLPKAGKKKEIPNDR